MRRLVLLLALLLAAAEAAAQISGNFALLSDNRFRGVSLSDRRPALQADIAYDHTSGLYAGAVASTVWIEGADSSLSAEGYAGFSHPLNERLSYDLGAARYLYPDSDTRGSYDYSEVYAGISLDRVQARMHYSDKYYGRDVHALYTEVNGSLQLTDAFALVAHIGYLERFGQNPYQMGGPSSSQWDGKIGLLTEAVGFTFELSVVGTNVPQDRCIGGSRACAVGVVLAVSRGF